GGRWGGVSPSLQIFPLFIVKEKGHSRQWMETPTFPDFPKVKEPQIANKTTITPKGSALRSDRTTSLDPRTVGNVVGDGGEHQPIPGFGRQDHAFGAFAPQLRRLQIGHADHLSAHQ